jgi:NADH dehydrogenase/NADH:ubiquinone oxidoreductase subunit G
VASITIPVADTFEIEGTFVNEKGIAQTFGPVLPLPAGVEPAWKTVSDLARAMDAELGFDDLKGLRQGLQDAAEAAQ